MTFLQLLIFWKIPEVGKDEFGGLLIRENFGEKWQILANGQDFLWQKIFPDNFFLSYFHSLKRSIFYLLRFHILKYKYEAALAAYSYKFKSSSGGKSHWGNIWLSPSKKTLFHFRTCMLYKKGNLSFWQELILFIQLLFVRGVFFYHNLVENMLEKDSTTDKCQPALGFATFVWRYKQLHRKFEQNSKQVLNLPSVKSLWILFKQNSQHWKD